MWRTYVEYTERSKVIYPYDSVRTGSNMVANIRMLYSAYRSYYGKWWKLNIVWVGDWRLNNHCIRLRSLSEVGAKRPDNFLPAQGVGGADY